MPFARAAALPKGLGRTVLRRAGTSSRSRSWKQPGRRGYASDHGHSHKEGSEIPWMVGSIAVTVPAAGWLLQQGPKKSDHGHDTHHGKHEEKEEQEPEEESKDEEAKDEPKEENKEEGKEESKEEGEAESKSEDEDQGKDKGKDEGKEQAEGGDDKSDDSSKQKGSDSSSGKQLSEDGGMSKGPGENQKGERAPTEKKGEKDSQGDHSGAKHPYIDDPEKSKKGVGVTETAKIHGTVDPSASTK